jgi:hypothetical protein
MDQTRKSDQYFQYLRTRYLGMSAEVFGRPLEVVTHPLGDNDAPPEMLAPGKAAGSADAE